MDTNSKNASTMKNLPSEEQPYEKCLEYGPERLTDAELLSVIIRTGSLGIKSLSLAEDILNLSGAPNKLLGLHQLTVNDLMQVKGIGKVKAIQIKCMTEFSRRIAKAEAFGGLSFDLPETIARYYMEDFRHLGQEQMLLMMLNTKNKLLGEQIISKGTVNASLISPREIFLEALHYHAVSIVLIHNHPSGDPSPSRDDIQITRRIQKAGSMLGIELLDHIILGDKAYVSLRERRIL